MEKTRQPLSMTEAHRRWPEFSLLDLLLEREGMARSPDVWFNIHALLLSRIATNQELSSAAAIARLIGPLVCKSPEHQKRIDGVINEWLTGKIPDTTTLITTPATPSEKTIGPVLRRFKQLYWLAAALLLCVLFVLIKAEFYHQPEVTRPPVPEAKPPLIDKSPTQSEKTIPITDTANPNTLPMPVKPEHRQAIYWILVAGLPLLALVLYLLWRYLPQMILRKQQQDDDQRILGLKIKDFQQNPDIPFSSAKTAGDLSPLLRPVWTESRQLHVADTVAATANNFGFFSPVYRQRIQRPEYVVLVQSLHGYDQIAEVAELFIQALQQKSKHIQIRGYRFRDDPRRLHPIASAQPKGDADKVPLSLLQLAKQRRDARLIVISDWDIAYLPYQPGQAQGWLKELDEFNKRVWLCPGHDTPYWSELAKTQAQRLNIRLLPLSSGNIQELAQWLSQEHNPLAPLGHSAGDHLPPVFAETSESWLSWRPPHGVDLKQLLKELRIYLGNDGFLLLQALAVFPKPVWPLPYILDKQLFSGATKKSRQSWLSWWRKPKADVEPTVSYLPKEQRLINIGRLPWSRHAYMPDYLRKGLLKALTRTERKHIRSAWKAIIDKIAITPSAEKIDIPIALSNASNIQLQHFLLSQEQDNALDDAIFANILLGGNLGLLDFKLPQLLSGLLPGAAKLLDLRPAVAALILAALSGWGLDYLWHQGGQAWLASFQASKILEENSQWQVQLAYQPDTQPLAQSLKQTLADIRFPVALQTAKTAPDSQQNLIRYASGGVNVARRIQQRLQWLAYGAEAKLELVASLPPQSVQLALTRSYRHGSGFNDTLVNPYENPAQKLEAKANKLYSAFKESDKLEALKEFQEPDMVAIPPGTFLMGSNEKEQGRIDSEGPQHEVAIGYAFEIGKTEVTFAQYEAFAKMTGRKIPDDNGWGRGNRPVIYVSFDEAQAYTQWLAQQTGKRYRLPTEAEWEYVARAGSKTAYWWGDSIGKNRANCYDCGSRWDFKQTAPVESFKPNPFGLYDTAGNMLEWTQDCWHEYYSNAPADGSAWLAANQGECFRRVVRGGSWIGSPQSLRSADRGWNLTDGAYYDVGFRVARAL